tara:strand:+ start:104 stop:817 length:714 start_codon:yes stop_codon:yes gene_type:complete
MKSVEPNQIYDNGDQIVLFKCIVDFIHALREMFGDKQHSLELYDLLMEKTGIIHQDPIKKHIKLFHEFVMKNENAILKKDLTLMEVWKIRYSDKVYIDLHSIFEMASEETKNMIWVHLLTLLAVLVPSSAAKTVLSEKSAENQEIKSNDGLNEDDFLKNIVDKVGKHIDPTKTSDPAGMMNGIMESGVFTDLVKEMNDNINNGNIDLGKMMGSLQSMMGNVSDMLQNTDKLNNPRLS